MVTKVQHMNEDYLMIFLSRAVSTILMLLYVTYLTFMLKTHTSLFDEDPESVEGEAIAEAFSTALRPISAIGCLAISLTCVAFCTVALLSSIQKSSLKAHTLSLGFILFHSWENLTCYASACWIARNDGLDIMIVVIIGSSMQIMLFAWPCLVVLGWMLDEQMAFNLYVFEAAVIFLGVTVSSDLVSDGKSNYCGGVMCIAL